MISKSSVVRLQIVDSPIQQLWFSLIEQELNSENLDPFQKWKFTICKFKRQTEMHLDRKQRYNNYLVQNI